MVYLRKLILLAILLFSTSNAQYDIYEEIDFGDVKFSTTDLGKMWTFDDIPFEYWKAAYNFEPGEDWILDIQKSALQFGRGCSAAFVSEDGLIMTNHHCARGSLQELSGEGEDLLKNGFYAETLSDERKAEGLFVDQLVLIEDVTGDVKSSFEMGKSAEEKVKLRDEKISEIEKRYENETGLICRIVKLYEGGKYSLYGYKRYENLKLVMAPEFQVASTGWDWDNFTYPRYELDFMFFRAYDENDQPVKSENFFKWSPGGAKENELVFIVGRPGNTDRLLSVAQLELYRDKFYPTFVLMFNEVYKVYYELFQRHPERESELLNAVMGFGNARKSYAGTLLGLRDEYLMAKKRAFENDFKSKVKGDSYLNEKFGHVWKSIEIALDEQRRISDEYYGLNVRSFIRPVYFDIAERLVEYAEQMQLDEEKRKEDYRPDNLKSTFDKIFPADYDEEFESLMLTAVLNFMSSTLPSDHKINSEIFKGETGKELSIRLFNESLITSKEKFERFIKNNPNEILNSTDPFIRIVKFTQERYPELQAQMREIQNTTESLNQLLGEAVFEVYGNTLSPDATSTLRITDGVIKGYEYNGTLAPPFTTFYGMLDRFYSFGGNTYPWGLPENWQNIPKDFDLSTKVGFVSTNDIVGGNSGSSVINQFGEVVGVVHDGNLESLTGDFIYLPEVNRAVGSDSRGIMEALVHLYRADRLVKELKIGKISD